MIEKKAYKKLFRAVIGFALVALLVVYNSNSEDKTMSGNIYQFSAKTIDGAEKSLADYKGKVVLIVNVASKCGFTKQYEGLEKLYKKYKDKGLVILGFPCNQFGSQEPGSSEEIKSFCSLTYGVSFDMFEKIDVNGENAHPLYKFLTSEKKGFITSAIKWNFTKFLINKNGEPIERFATQTTPESLESKIEEALGK
jgi:glutathione peroxidase